MKLSNDDWEDLGRIYLPENNRSQCPTIYLKNNIARIFFSEKNKDGFSRILQVDFDLDTLQVITGPELVLNPGQPGYFDASGVMPSSIIDYRNNIFLYYVGWSQRKDVPYHNLTGLAISSDGGETFNALRGPILHSCPAEPLFNGTSCVFETDHLYNVYMSSTEWLEVDGLLEPRYRLHIAESFDGVQWNQRGKIFLDYASPSEAGLTKASALIDIEGHLHLWFSSRNLANYRKSRKDSYSINYSYWDWIKPPTREKVVLPQNSWNRVMSCYSDVIFYKNSLYCFYNGDGFGETGILLARKNLNEIKIF